MFEILQDELKNLKLAVENDKGAKGKKGKGGKAAKKGAKGKKDKKDKGKKGKKEKDLTSNRTIESLVEEMIQTGILQKVFSLKHQYAATPLDSFLGEFDTMGVSQSKETFILPSLAELRKTVIEYCILPMGFHEEDQAFPKLSSFLFYGPSGMIYLSLGVGKSHLVKAIATELGAQIFNLSPKNTAGQYLGKTNVSKMAHIAFKVARAQGPSIIYIDGIEMVFAKKVPKDDTSDPKRIKKDLLKSIKLIKDGSEKVILIATTSKPWDSDVKAMLSIFDKLIFCPKPDYSSRMLMWKTYTEKLCGYQVRHLNFSLLTRSSEGLTAGSIYSVCTRLLTERRLKKV